MNISNVQNKGLRNAKITIVEAWVDNVGFPWWKGKGEDTWIDPLQVRYEYCVGWVVKFYFYCGYVGGVWKIYRGGTSNCDIMLCPLWLIEVCYDYLREDRIFKNLSCRGKSDFSDIEPWQSTVSRHEWKIRILRPWLLVVWVESFSQNMLTRGYFILGIG